MTDNTYNAISHKLRPITISVFWHAAVEKHYANFIEELAKALPHCQVDLYVPTEWEEFPGRKSYLSPTSFSNTINLKIIPTKTLLSKKYKFFFWNPIELVRAIRKSHLTITFTEPYILSALQFCLAKQNSKSKLVIFSAQNIYKDFPAIVSQLEKWALRSSDSVMICNDEAGAILTKKGFTGSFFKLKLGIPLVPSGTKPHQTSIAKKEGLTIVYLGRFEKQKGVYDILSIAASPKSKNHIFELYGTGSEFENIWCLAQKLPNVKINKALPISEVQKVLQRADLNLLLSYELANWKEQFGRIIVEAMAESTPTIAYATGEIPNVVGNTGYLCPEGDIQLVIETIDNYQRHPEERISKLAECNTSVTNYYWNSIANDFAKFLKSEFKI